MQVILFDVDGTLIHSGGAGGTALRGAFSKQFSVPQPGDVPFAGRTDRGIAQSLFQLHAVQDTEQHWLQLREAYLAELSDQLPRHQGRVLPGINDLLEQLDTTGDRALGLLTGNVRLGAKQKLEYYGLFQHFRFGGYGDQHVLRDDVAREAVRIAREALDSRFETDNLWIVGDTPLDIQCARTVGAHVLAVATGTHTREQLAACEPDLLLEDLSQPEAFLECLGS